MVVGKPLLTVLQIQDRVKELAREISTDYKGKEIISIGVLKGAFMFFSDIVKLIQVPTDIDFLNVSSYSKTESTGKIKIHTDIREDIRGRHVLLIEDIIDTGITINYLKKKLLAKKPASLRICCLLDKKERRTADVEIDYTGFEIPDKYLVGYGLDYENKFRNLPYIAILKKRG
ncbi:MAG: hypoxanthine phosphoribosyltransferase [Nitrospirae bacterium]|nr:hypoxanthine phosphoribosyltransferase [Nitrospirota bacterium]